MADFQTDLHSIQHLVHTSRTKEEALHRFHNMHGFSLPYDQAQKALTYVMEERFAEETENVAQALAKKYI